MKKVLAVILIMLLTLTLVACSEKPSPQQPTQEPAKPAAEAPVTEPTPEPQPEEPEETPEEEPEKEPEVIEVDKTIVLGQPITFGDYEITVQSFELIKDYDDEEFLKITYDWMNNSDKEEMATTTFSFRGYQDGVETDMAITISDDLDLGIGQKKVRAGYGQEGVEDILALDPTKPIEIELSEWISFGGDVWTIKLEPGVDF